MKERVLTNAELGNYAFNGSYDTMEYTWTDSCHHNNHGYSSYDTSNCDNTNGYRTSKVKEMLETRYLPTIGETNLKEVNGYKIRLITKEELIGNLGYDENHKTPGDYIVTENVPTWVSQNFGENQNNVYGYWTMTPNPDSSSNVWDVYSSGRVHDHFDVNNYSNGVRPVINLLKSSID